MIVLITSTVTNEKTKEKKMVVSHGLTMNSMESVILPNVPPYEIGGRFDHKLGEWVLK